MVFFVMRHTHACTHTQAHMYSHTHVHTPTNIHAHTFPHMHVHAHTNSHVHTQSHMHTQSHTHTLVFLRTSDSYLFPSEPVSRFLSVTAADLWPFHVLFLARNNPFPKWCIWKKTAVGEITSEWRKRELTVGGKNAPTSTRSRSSRHPCADTGVIASIPPSFLGPWLCRGPGCVSFPVCAEALVLFQSTVVARGGPTSARHLDFKS